MSAPINEQQDQFQDEVNRTINRFRFEYDMTYADVIGCLEIIKMDLFREIVANNEGEAESDEE